MTDDPVALKVAICECLIAINDDVDPPNREKWGPIIPPTAIDWIGDALVTAVLLADRYPKATATPENVDTPACSECWGEGSYWAEGNPDTAGILYIPTPNIEFDGTVLVRCWKCNNPDKDNL